MSNPWKNAKTVADLGRLMADWLEGRGPVWPGYCDTRPDEETLHLIPTLARVNRAGYVTTDSQPAHPPTRGWDGRTYQQRAFVVGWITDQRLVDRIRTAAKRGGITVIAHRPSGPRHPVTVVTEADGQPCATFGNILGHRQQIDYEWPGLSGDAVRELRTSTLLALIDPQ